MVDPESVLQRLDRLGELLRVLERVRREGRETLVGDLDTQLKTEHALQVAIQICIDVGAHLIAELGLRMPDDYRGIFEQLGGAAVLDEALAPTASPKRSG